MINKIEELIARNGLIVVGAIAIGAAITGVEMTKGLVVTAGAGPTIAFGVGITLLVLQGVAFIGAGIKEKIDKKRA